MNPSDFRAGVAALIVTVVSWGGLFPAGKLVLASLDPYYLSAIRYGVTSLLFLALLWLREGSAALHFEGRLAELAIYGTLGFAGFSLFSFEGLRFTTPQQAAVIAAMQPIMVAAWQWSSRGVRPARATLLCVFAALVGCAVVVSRGDPIGLLDGGSGVGDALVLVGAVCWVGYTMGAPRFANWSAIRYTALSCAVGTLAILFFTLLATLVGHARVPAAPDVQRVAVPLGFMIAMASFVAVLMWNFGVQKMGPLNASLFGNFIPVVAFAIGVMQGQSIAVAEYLGAALVIGALVTNNLVIRRSLRQAAMGAAA